LRRLSAIVAIDVVGYSAMMARDEAGTLERLRAYRKGALDPLVARHNGRVVKLMGDGALVEFASVVDATECAFALQRAGRDDLPLRIGINMGDVIIEGGDIYGDGVNIAARLEALAQPGGVCVSGIVRESLGNRVDADFSDGGEQTLKNIATPVRVFHWHPDSAASPPPPPEVARPAKPSIAVLAFDNMSGDPDQEYFSDGIAEDIITELSHFQEFFVIARNSSFAYKGRAVRIEDVCDELGVRYLLEGSVRRAAGRVRVTAQLIDGHSGMHLWAERFDRNLDDVFAVQDEITRSIVTAVAPETLDAELRRARSQPPGNLSAWDKVLRARLHFSKFTREDSDRTRELLTQAIAEAPDMPEAYSSLAMAELIAMLQSWRSDPIAAIGAANDAALRAVQLNDRDANAHLVRGLCLVFARSFEEGMQHVEKAMRLNPNMASAFGMSAALYGVSRDYERAKEVARLAQELSPHDPLRPIWLAGQGIGALIAGDYEGCVKIAKQTLRDYPNYVTALRQHACASAHLGRMDEARTMIDRLLELAPDMTISRVRRMVPVRHAEDMELWLNGLRMAGLPEGSDDPA